MNTFEWLTYYNLHQAGPCDQSERKNVPAPPWGTGEPPEISTYSSDVANTFKNIADRRRSVRDLSHEVSQNALLEVLSLTLGRPYLRPYARRYPTSGSCDELGILVVASRVEGMRPAAYWASANDQSLKKAAELTDEYLAFEEVLCTFFSLPISESPAVSLLIMADWKKLESKYQNCVLASALLDCGGLLQTLSIAAATLRLKACISCCIQPTMIERWLGLSGREYGHIGTFCLGAR